MVKIDWSQETGFTLADAGNFSKPLISIEQCMLGGIINGYIQKIGHGVFCVSIYQMGCSEMVQATESGFDGIIKALNSHDWSRLTKAFHDYRNVEIWTTSDEISQRWKWSASTYRALDEGQIGTWTWYARVCEELYDERLWDWELKAQWREVIDSGFQEFTNFFCIGKALDRGYAKEQELHRNGTADLWLQGRKRRAVVGMELFRALAVIGVEVFVGEQHRSIPSSIMVMEGDDLQGLAGDYPTFAEVEKTLILQRLCGKVLALKDLNYYLADRIKTKASSVRFAKNLHSEVAANLDLVLLACELLKLKGLVEGPSLAEALCSASGVELSAVEAVLHGHKRKYLPHAIWSLKNEHKNDGLMPMFNASFGSTSIAKLPEDSLVNLYIGDLTGCCQHLTGAGKRVCKDGWKNSHNCNYIFKSDSGAIVAHMWVWMDRAANLIIDSVEARSYASMEEIAELIRAFGKSMEARGHKTLVSKQALGKGRKVIEILNLEEKCIAGQQMHNEEWGYSDTDPGDKCYVVM